MTDRPGFPVGFLVGFPVGFAVGNALQDVADIEPRSLFAASEKGVWFDPSDFSTLFQDSAGTIPVTAVGQPVGKILDKSGNGNHASQATASKRPTLTQDGNGAYSLLFDGSSDGLATSAINFTATDKMSVFAGVSKNNDTTGVICELSNNVNANTGTFYLIAGDDPGPPGRGYTSLSRGSASASLTQRAYFTNSGADTAVVAATHDIAGDRSSVRRNGVAGTDGTADKGAGNFGNYALYIGARAGTSLFFNGRLYGLIVRGATSSADQIAQMNRWMNAKTGAY